RSDELAPRTLSVALGQPAQGMSRRTAPWCSSPARGRSCRVTGARLSARRNVEDFGLDPQDLGAALDLGGPTAGQEGHRYLMVAYVAVGHAHELDLVPELDPARGCFPGREFAVVRMGPENDHPKRFFGGRARFFSAGRCSGQSGDNTWEVR